MLTCSLSHPLTFPALGASGPTSVTVATTNDLTSGGIPYTSSGTRLAGDSPLRRLSATAVSVGTNLVWNGSTNSVKDTFGPTNPEGVVTASPGSIYRAADNGGIWKKTTGTGNTGWAELGTGGGGTNTALLAFQVIGVGTDFSYTIGQATYEKIAFGTSGPSFVLTNQGTYQVIVNVAAFDASTAYQDFYLTNVTDHLAVPGTVHSVSANSSSIDNSLVIPFQITTTGANKSFELWGQTHNATYTAAGVLATSTVVDVVLTSNATGGNGIITIGGLSGSSQSFAVGTSGTDFAITSLGTTHTWDLPTASAVNRGALSSEDWIRFNSAVGAGGVTNYFDFTFITNITVQQTAIFNSKVTINTNVFITNGGSLFIDGTNIAKINPTTGAIPVRTGTNTFGDSPLTVSGANVTASGSVALSGQTNLLADAGGYLTYNGAALVTGDSTNTFTNKTLDAAGTGNVVKMTGYIQLIHPHRADGTGAVIATSDTTVGYYGHALFSGSAATNANWIEYRLAVPDDIDTAVDLKVARWKVRLAAADTAASTYTIGMASVADSASHDSPTLGQHVTLSVGADASGASGDVETVSAVTLTSWKSNVTAGQLWVIRVARDGSDTSTQAHYDAGLVIQYGITQ